MEKDKISVTIAGIKMKLRTSSPEEVMRMANSIDADVRKKLPYVNNIIDHALLMMVMEQAEELKRNTELIHRQQEQIFALTKKNSALLGEAPESAPISIVENAVMEENYNLQKKIDRLTDEIARLKGLSYCEQD